MISRKRGVRAGLESAHIQSLESGCEAKDMSRYSLAIVTIMQRHHPDSNGNPPSIIRYEEVDPNPPLLKEMIKRMVAWHVLPPSCIPNSCIVNIYDKDDCIPPHIDHHDFVRPFCTVSFFSECNIIFGMDLKIIGSGDFSDSASIPLLLGSVLVLNGNDADIVKHCVLVVSSQRISITVRKMDDSKIPYDFIPDPDLQISVHCHYKDNNNLTFFQFNKISHLKMLSLHKKLTKLKSAASTKSCTIACFTETCAAN